ncbi:MAG TPA: methyltransferase, partial [Steroidobacteraceae bacterium]
MGVSPGGGPAASLNTFLGLMSGHAVVRSIAVIAELGVPDLLASGPKTAAELARACGADPDALHRLLRALAALGIFTETRESGLFGLTALSEPLRSDSPHSLRDFVRLRGGEPYWSAWGALDKAVRTGQAAFEHAHGATHFEYLAQHPEAARRFDDGMRSLMRQIDASIVAAYDFSRFSRLMDAGGGQ